MSNNALRRYDLLKLDNQLCFALYAATRSMTRTYREFLDPLGLTYPQYIVLTCLWDRDKQTISTLGETLMLDSGTLTPLVKRLENMQLVNRKRRKLDEREVEVYLTSKGLALRDQAVNVRKAVVCRLNMSERDISQLRKKLMNLISQLDEPTAIKCLTDVPQREKLLA